MPGFLLSQQPVDTAPLRAALQRREAGAYACFEGWVRDHHAGRAVVGLRYEAYAALAEREGEAILREARERFAIADLGCMHRVGSLEVGELAVWVGVSAAHRDAAFAACRFVIDEVKARVPIWKHERYAQGDAAWLHPGPEDSDSGGSGAGGADGSDTRGPG